jgi:predicted alpha/beta-hydrolase family hydrolase
LKNPDTLTIELEAGATVTALAYEPEGTSSRRALILAHGAGAGQRSAFMVAYARALAGRGIETFTFNFPYTEHGRRIPDRRPVLEQCYRAVVAAIHARTPQSLLFVGGKSMGGRIATHIAAADPALPIAGLVLLGYPLHPPGRPSDRRDAHLPDIHRQMLIVQGSRDTFGTPAEFQAVRDRMSPPPTLHVVEGGDHSFKVPGGAMKQAAVQEEVHHIVAEWIMRTNAAA